MPNLPFRPLAAALAAALATPLVALAGLGDAIVPWTQGAALARAKRRRAALAAGSRAPI